VIYKLCVSMFPLFKQITCQNTLKLGFKPVKSSKSVFEYLDSYLVLRICPLSSSIAIRLKNRHFQKKRGTFNSITV